MKQTLFGPSGVAPSSIALAVSALLCSGAAVAEQTDQARSGAEQKIETIVVTATKTDARLSEVPQAVSLLTEEDIERIQPVNIGDLLEQIPGVAIDTSNPYMTQPSVRGLDRSRVIISVDGANLTADGNKGMALSPLDIDPYLIKQVEVQKGASSALYGSGGMGGVIAFKTKSVADLLEGDGQIGGFVRSQYDTLEGGWQNTVAGYGSSKDGRYDALLTGSFYDEDSSTALRRTYDSQKYSAQFGINFDDSQRLQLTLSDSQREYFSENFVEPDKTQDQQLRLRYDISRGEHLNLLTNFSFTETERNASMLKPGAPGDPNFVVEQQDSTIKRWQWDLQNSHYLFAAGIDHEITWGLNNYFIDQQGRVNGKPDDFNAPNGERLESAAFVQERMQWQWLTVTGALRYNYYKMDSSSAAADGTSVTEKELLPSIGAVAELTDWMALHLNYSHDFRAPSVDDLYTQMSNPFVPVDIIANPDLKPESSKNAEVGFSFHSGNLDMPFDWYARVTYFDQQLTDMITLDRIGVDPDTGRQLFGSVNVDSVDRVGAELELNIDYQQLSFSLGTDYLKETDNSDGSVDRAPKSLQLSLSYHFVEPDLRISWLGQALESHQDLYDDSIEHAGFFKQDLRVSWQDAFKVDGLGFSVGVNNLFDNEYVTSYGSAGDERHYLISVNYKL